MGDDELDALFPPSGDRSLFADTERDNIGIGFALADIARQKQQARENQRLKLLAERQAQQAQIAAEKQAQTAQKQVGNLEVLDAVLGDLPDAQKNIVRRLGSTNLNQGLSALRRFQELNQAQAALQPPTPPTTEVLTNPQQIADATFDKAIRAQFDLNTAEGVAQAQPIVARFRADPAFRQQFVDAALAGTNVGGSTFNALAGSAVSGLGNIVDTVESVQRGVTGLAGAGLGLIDPDLSGAITNQQPQPGAAGRLASGINQQLGFDRRSPQDIVANAQLQQTIQDGTFGQTLDVASNNPRVAITPTIGSLVAGGGLAKLLKLGVAGITGLFGAIETGGNIADVRKAVAERVPDATQAEQDTIVGGITSGELAANTLLAFLGPEAAIARVPLIGAASPSRIANATIRGVSGASGEILSEAGNAAVQVTGQALAGGQSVPQALADSANAIANQGALGALLGAPVGAGRGALQAPAGAAQRPNDPASPPPPPGGSPDTQGTATTQAASADAQSAPVDTGEAATGDAILNDLLNLSTTQTQTEAVDGITQAPQGQTTQEGQTQGATSATQGAGQATQGVVQTPNEVLGQRVQGALSVFTTPAPITPVAVDQPAPITPVVVNDPAPITPVAVDQPAPITPVEVNEPAPVEVNEPAPVANPDSGLARSIRQVLGTSTIRDAVVDRPASVGAIDLSTEGVIDAPQVQTLLSEAVLAPDTQFDVNSALDTAALVPVVVPAINQPSTTRVSVVDDVVFIPAAFAVKTNGILAKYQASGSKTTNALEVNSGGKKRFVPRRFVSDFLRDVSLPFDENTALNTVSDAVRPKFVQLQQDVKSLNAVVKEQNLGVTFRSTARGDLDTPAKQAFSFLEDVADVFGKRVGIVKPDGPRAVQGVVTGQTPGVIYLTEAVLKGKTKDSALFVLGHEIAESIKLNDQTLFDRVKKLAVEFAQTDNAKSITGIKSIVDVINSDTPDQGVADLVGTRLSDVNFWQYLKTRSKPTFNRLAVILEGFKNTVRAKLLGTTSRKARNKAAMAEFDKALAGLLEEFKSSPEMQSENVFFSEPQSPPPDGSAGPDGSAEPKQVNIRQTNLDGVVEQVSVVKGAVTGAEVIPQKSRLQTLTRFFKPIPNKTEGGLLKEGIRAKATRLFARQDGVLRRVDSEGIPAWAGVLQQLEFIKQQYAAFLASNGGADGLSRTMLDSQAQPLNRDNISVYEIASLGDARFQNNYNENTAPIVENMHALLRKIAPKPGVAQDFIGELLYVIHAPERNDITWLFSAPLDPAADALRADIIQSVRAGDIQPETGRNELSALVSANVVIKEGETAADARAKWVGAGLTDSVAKVLLARKFAQLEAPKQQVVRDILDTVKQLVEEQRRFHRESGSFDSVAQNMVDLIGFKAYVPLKGRSRKANEVLDTLFVSGSRSFVADGQALEGRKTFAKNPLVQLLTDTQRASQERSLQAQLGVFLKNAVLAKMSGVFNTQTEGAYAAAIKTIETDNPEIRQKDIDAFIRNTQRAKKFIKYLPEENLIASIDMGNALVKQAYQPKNTLINTGSEIIDAPLRIAAAGTSFLSRTHTTWSLQFQVVNNVREMLNATFTAAGEVSFEVAARIPVRAVSILPALSEYLAKQGKPKQLADAITRNKNIAYIDQFFKLGGRTAFASGLSLQQQGKSLAKLNKIPDRKAVRTLKTGIDYINDLSELSPRIALFAELIESGQMRPQEAAAFAKNLANFEKRGEFGGVLGALIMFARPSALGAAKALETVIEGKNGSTVVAMLFGLGAAAYSLSLFLGGGEEDDPQGRARGAFDQANRWTREARFYYAPDADPIRVPFGYGLGAFIGLGAQFAALSSGNVTKGEFFGNSLEIAKSNFSPLPTAGIDLVESPVQAIAQSATPSLLLGILNLSNNTSGFGNDIVPKWIEDKENLQGVAAGRSTTGTQYQAAALELRDVLGININPAQIKYFTEYYGAPLGEFSSVIFSLTNERDLVPRRDVPFVGGFIASPSDTRVRQFWEARARIGALAAERAQLVKMDSGKPDGQKDRLQRFDAENTQLVALKQALSEYNKQARVLQHEWNVLLAKDPSTITSKQRTKRLDEISQRLLPIRAQFLEVVRQVDQAG